VSTHYETQSSSSRDLHEKLFKTPSSSSRDLHETLSRPVRRRITRLNPHLLETFTRPFRDLPSMTRPVTRAAFAEMNRIVEEENRTYGFNFDVSVLYRAYESRQQDNLSIGDFVYVCTNPHRGRKGQLIKKRGYTQWYIRLIPQHRREFPIIIYRSRKHLYQCYIDDPVQFVFCECSRDERENEEFVCPYWGCYH
jgi:hypothetical protein